MIQPPAPFPTPEVRGMVCSNPLSLLSFPGCCPHPLGAFQSQLININRNGGKMLAMNIKTPSSPFWHWSDFRNWRQKTKNCNKRYSHCSYCSGNSQGFWQLRARNQGWRPSAPENSTLITWMTKYVSYKSQYHPHVQNLSQLPCKHAKGTFCSHHCKPHFFPFNNESWRVV